MPIKKKEEEDPLVKDETTGRAAYCRQRRRNEYNNIRVIINVTKIGASCGTFLVAKQPLPCSSNVKKNAMLTNLIFFLYLKNHSRDLPKQDICMARLHCLCVKWTIY